MASFVTPPVTKVLTTSENAWTQFTPFTRWMPTAAVENISALVEVQDLAGAIRLYPAWQLAETDTDEPDTPASAGAPNSISADGVHLLSLQSMTTLDANTPSRYFIRFGVLTRSVTDGEWCSATVTATFSGSSN